MFTHLLLLRKDFQSAELIYQALRFLRDGWWVSQRRDCQVGSLERIQCSINAVSFLIIDRTIKLQRGKGELQTAEWHRSTILCFLKNGKCRLGQILSTLPPWPSDAGTAPWQSSKADTAEIFGKGSWKGYSKDISSLLCQFLTRKVMRWAKMESRLVTISPVSCYLEGKRWTSVCGD